MNLNTHLLWPHTLIWRDHALTIHCVNIIFFPRCQCCVHCELPLILNNSEHAKPSLIPIHSLTLEEWQKLWCLVIAKNNRCFKSYTHSISAYSLVLLWLHEYGFSTSALIATLHWMTPCYGDTVPGTISVKHPWSPPMRSSSPWPSSGQLLNVSRQPLATDYGISIHIEDCCSTPWIKTVLPVLSPLFHTGFELCWIQCDSPFPLRDTIWFCISFAGYCVGLLTHGFLFTIL